MKVVFLTDGLLIPASRFRCEQFFRAFEAAGVRCSLNYAYGPLYNTAINRPWGSAYKLLSRVRRGFHQVVLPDDSDLVFLQRTAFPHTPLFEFLLAQKDVPVIFDFDDNLTVNSKGGESKARRYTFNRAVAWADQLIAGNSFLAEQAGRPDKTTIIPTVIDAERYVPNTRNAEKETKTVIGWMGTAGNFQYLERVVPSLTRVLSRYPDVIVRIVSNSTFLPLQGHKQVEQIVWTPETEIALLQSFDIGLMPLENSALTRGKCAFKMIQYMAVGCPVVVSAVGANVEVFGDMEPPGFLQRTDFWDDSLSELIEDAKLRRIMGEAGRVRVENSYSINAVLPTYLQLFDRLLASR